MHHRVIAFRYVWPAELDLMARLAGMSLASRWADWHRQPFGNESTSHSLRLAQDLSRHPTAGHHR